MNQPSPRQFERLLKLDELIQAGNATTAGAIAERLEVSRRTVVNDLNFLRDRFFAPLEYTGGQGWRYSDPQWRLPMVPLTQGELFALVLGSRMLEAAAGAAYAQELQSAIDQLVRRMPEQTWADLQTVVEERVQFGAGSLLEFNPEYWKVLLEASRSYRTVEMTYYTASSDTLSTRKFDPHLMYVYRGTNPYTIGYCHKRKEIRVFRVDRIRVLLLTEEPFERQTDFQARQYFEQIFQIEAGTEVQYVAVRFGARAAPFVRERRWHPSQRIEEHGDGSMTLHMAVSGLKEVQRWVLGYGAEARAEAPSALVAMVREEVTRLVQEYDSTG